MCGEASLVGSLVSGELVYPATGQTPNITTKSCTLTPQAAPSCRFSSRPGVPTEPRISQPVSINAVSSRLNV